MNPLPGQPKVTMSETPDYRENYSNSVQIRVSLWDFFITLGTAQQNTPDAVTLNVFQGVYLSPQQAKALSNLLQQNISHYESAFGEIKLEPQQGAPEGGIVQ